MTTENASENFFSEMYFLDQPETSQTQKVFLEIFTELSSIKLDQQKAWHEEVLQCLLSLNRTPRKMHRFQRALSKRVPHFIHEVDSWDICLVSALEANDQKAFSLMVEHAATLRLTKSSFNADEDSPQKQILNKFLAAGATAEGINGIKILFTDRDQRTDEDMTRAKWPGHWRELVSAHGAFIKISELYADRDAESTDIYNFLSEKYQILQGRDRFEIFIDIVHRVLDNNYHSLGEFFHCVTVIGRFLAQEYVEPTLAKRISFRISKIVDDLTPPDKLKLIQELFSIEDVADILCSTIQFYMVENDERGWSSEKFNEEIKLSLSSLFLNRFKQKYFNGSKVKSALRSTQDLGFLYRVLHASELVEKSNINHLYLKTLFLSSPGEVETFINLLLITRHPYLAVLSANNAKIVDDLVGRENFLEVTSQTHVVDALSPEVRICIEKYRQRDYLDE